MTSNPDACTCDMRCDWSYSGLANPTELVACGWSCGCIVHDPTTEDDHTWLERELRYLVEDKLLSDEDKHTIFEHADRLPPAEAAAFVACARKTCGHDDDLDCIPPAPVVVAPFVRLSSDDRDLF
jgi:hypothetical protein